MTGSGRLVKEIAKPRRPRQPSRQQHNSHSHIKAMPIGIIKEIDMTVDSNWKSDSSDNELKYFNDLVKANIPVEEKLRLIGKAYVNLIIDRDYYLHAFKSSTDNMIALAESLHASIEKGTDDDLLSVLANLNSKL